MQIKMKVGSLNIIPEFIPFVCLQKLFIIFAFNETLIEAAVSQIHRLPWIGNKLEVPLRELLNKQKEKLHRKSEAPIDQVCRNYITLQ